MFESIGGLPVHPLVVHLPVVLVPLAAIGVVLMAVRPRWLDRFGIPVAVIAGVGWLGTMLAASSGEELEEQIRDSGQNISSTLHDHAEMGEQVQVVAGVFFFLVLAWVVFAWWRRRVGEEKAVSVAKKPKVVNTVLAVIVLVSGAFATYSVYATGHSGAKSVWENTLP